MKKLTILCLLMLATTATFGQSFYTETGTAVFYSKVPLHDFEGRSENLTGLINLEDNSVDFYLDLATLDTGNGKRDKDMRLTLETEEFPFGEFTGKLSGFSLEKGTKQEVTVNGVFKIHGKEQKMEAKGTLKPVGDTLVLNASWKLMLKDYEIVPPQVLFLKVDQEQEIEITAVLTIKE